MFERRISVEPLLTIPRSLLGQFCGEVLHKRICKPALSFLLFGPALRRPKHPERSFLAQIDHPIREGSWHQFATNGDDELIGRPGRMGAVVVQPGVTEDHDDDVCIISARLNLGELLTA